jgi:uncharacterized protein YkwD
MKTKVLWRVLLLTFLTVSTQAQAMRPADVSLFGETLLAMINRYRQDNGLTMLQFDPKLIQLAKKHSLEMFQQKAMGHRNFSERFDRSRSHLCVENVGWNYKTSQKMFEGWRNSPGHDRNMRAEGINKVGIAEVGDYITFFACQ